MNSDKSGYYDYSTLNLEALKHLPIHRLPPTYKYQAGPGNGCFGDPPGFPSYFTRSIYTQHGNEPRRGAQMVLTIPEEKPRVFAVAWKSGENWDDHNARRKGKLRRLWKPLPLNHPRTRAWIRDAHRHLNHCYIDDSKTEYDGDRIFIWPVPDYKLRSFIDKEKAAAVAPLAIPANHAAVRRIRKFYPDYQPEPDLIDNPPTAVGPQWWERYATQPTPEQCAGLGGSNPHPIGNPCQTCGHVVEEEAS